jgi:hypothetical protein
LRCLLPTIFVKADSRRVAEAPRQIPAPVRRPCSDSVASRALLHARVRHIPLAVYTSGSA